MNRFDWLRLIGPSIMDLFGRLLGRAASMEGGVVGSESSPPPPPLPKRRKTGKRKTK